MEWLKKSRLMLRLSALGMVAALLLTLPSIYSIPVAADKVSDKRQELQDLQEEQKKLEASIKELGSDIKDQQTKVNKLYKQVSNLEAQVEAYESEIASVDKVIAEKDARIAELNAEIAVKEKEMEAIMDQLKKRIKAISKTGNYSSFQLLMNTADYEDYLLKSQVLKLVSDHDRELRETAEAEKKVIADKRQEVENDKAVVEASKADLVELKTGLDTQFASLEKLYTDAYNAKKSLEKKLGTYEKEEAKIEKAKEELEREIAELLGNPTSQTYGGKMYWPVPGIKTLSRGYKKGHPALDIWGVGILKKTIVAAADGVVVKAPTGQHYSYGYYVMVDHGYDKNGVRIMTLYAHMYSKPAVKVGQTVVGGVTKLGVVGSTGNSTGPHLHFEVREDGVRIDSIKKGYIVMPK